MLVYVFNFFLQPGLYASCFLIIIIIIIIIIITERQNALVLVPESLRSSHRNEDNTDVFCLFQALPLEKV